MRLAKYEYSTEEHAELFKFISVGPKGKIQKLVIYSKMFDENIYNLAFGDYDEETGTVNDKRITNNDDSEKILATVASTLYVFTNSHPDVWIYATGSSSARTRLYRIGISTNLIEIQNDFDVYGLQNDTWQVFSKGQDYEAFLVRRK
jgi:hypothetical protein